MIHHPAVTTVAGSDGEKVLMARLLGFVRFLRDNDFHIGIQEKLDMVSLADSLLLKPRALRRALRSLFCTNSEQWHHFDEYFDAWWMPANKKGLARSGFAGQAEATEQCNDGAGRASPGNQVSDVDQAGEGDDTQAGEGGSREGASYHETLAGTDFRFITDEAQLHEMERMVENLARRMRRYFVRRQRIMQQGQRLHLRQTIHRSLAYGGMPLDLVYRQRKRLLPRLILLLDVSRSMSLYSYMFLRFARGLVGAFRESDAFVYHTRLVHVTDALREQDLVKVKEKLALLSAGWSGGTRIGECLRAFNEEYGRRLINARSVVMIVSDGYDTGEPALLGEQMKQISQRARKVVWLNPLLGREGYEPIAGGMQAALPEIDLFAPAHNLASLQALEKQLVDL